MEVCSLLQSRETATPGLYHHRAPLMSPSHAPQHAPSPPCRPRLTLAPCGAAGTRLHRALEGASRRCVATRKGSRLPNRCRRTGRELNRAVWGRLGVWRRHARVVLPRRPWALGGRGGGEEARGRCAHPRPGRIRRLPGSTITGHPYSCRTRRPRMCHHLRAAPRLTRGRCGLCRCGRGQRRARGGRLPHTGAHSLRLPLGLPSGPYGHAEGVWACGCACVWV